MTIPHKAGALAIVDEADDYARKAGRGEYHRGGGGEVDWL